MVLRALFSCGCFAHPHGAASSNDGGTTKETSQTERVGHCAVTRPAKVVGDCLSFDVLELADMLRNDFYTRAKGDDASSMVMSRPHFVAGAVFRSEQSAHFIGSCPPSPRSSRPCSLSSDTGVDEVFELADHLWREFPSK